MKKLFIIKVGTTFPTIAKQYGDFDAWTLATLGSVDVDTCILDVEHGASLPFATDCAGVIVTGSHSMVTDNLPWSTKLEAWIPSLLETKIPFLGICYGHQLLARSMGGEVGVHSGGKEIGSVEIELMPEYINDDLLQVLRQRFYVYVAHSQTVLRLPPGATRLAANSFEHNHIFRIGDCAWGVQFHPEYDARIMRSYIREHAEELESSGRNVSELLRTVKATPEAVKILKNFASIVQQKEIANSALHPHYTC